MIMMDCDEYLKLIELPYVFIRQILKHFEQLFCDINEYAKGLECDVIPLNKQNSLYVVMLDVTALAPIYVMRQLKSINMHFKDN